MHRFWLTGPRGLTINALSIGSSYSACLWWLEDRAGMVNAQQIKFICGVCNIIIAIFVQEPSYIMLSPHHLGYYSQFFSGHKAWGLFVHRAAEAGVSLALPLWALCFNQTLQKTEEAQELALLSLMSGTDYKGTSGSCSCQYSSSLIENYLTEGWFRKEP